RSALRDEQSVPTMLNHGSDGGNVAPDDRLPEAPGLREDATEALLGGGEAQHVASSDGIGLILKVNRVQLQDPAVRHFPEESFRMRRARADKGKSGFRQPPPNPPTRVEQRGHSLVRVLLAHE